MKDSWGPLKALAAASVINGVGDIFLCSVCGYGIAGAAWATMVSQVQHTSQSPSASHISFVALVDLLSILWKVGFLSCLAH
jgi:hypothetical protein